MVTPQSPATAVGVAPPVATTAPAWEGRRGINRDRLAAILMLAPSLLAIAIFVYGFIAWNAWASLTDWRSLNQIQGIGPLKFTSADFTGLVYERLFDTPRFGTDIRNNAIFTVAFLAACILLGLFLAILIDQKVKFEGIFRNIFLYPMAISFVVTGTIWRWIFLQLGWVTNKELALPALIIAATWQMSGFTMAMFIAAIRGIPDELREAARVDGATEFGIYRHVILPLINPIILSALIIVGHISLKIFDLVFVMTGGSPTLGYATDMPSLYLFELAFQSNLFGRAAAVSMLMLAFVAIVIVPYLISNLREEAET